jgi:HD-GYP domain-containing protein (c-di-GMP phosphodiesterase class II)
MKQAAYLAFEDADDKSKTVLLDKRLIRIGRLDENDLVLENPYISRCHAEIVRQADSFTICDLESTSGTFVNDQRIEEHTLSDGDRIRIGQGHGVEFTFRAPIIKPEAESTQETLRPVRIIAPDEARFVHTDLLPAAEELGAGTVDHLRALYEFTNELNKVTSQRDLCDKLASFLYRSLKAERSAVLLYEPEQDSLFIASTCPANGASAVIPSLGIARKIIEDNVAMLSIDASSDARFAGRRSVKLQSIRSVLCAPMGSQTRVWGACYVDHLTPERAFEDEELDFMTAVARHAGIAMENLYLLDEQRRSIESFIRTLSATIGARDDATAGHSARTGAYSSGIAKTMGLSPAQCRVIYYAGLLHDYGKIGTRDDVLLKPSELTPDEYEHVKEHPLHTFRILSKMRFPEDLAEIPMVAAAHHERWDGSGYPHGLKGEAIPLGGRIVAVADSYDAIAEERIYHDPIEPAAAFAEIVSRSGTYFDPAVVEAFTEFFEKEIGPRRQKTLKSGERKRQVATEV